MLGSVLSETHFLIWEAHTQHLIIPKTTATATIHMESASQNLMMSLCVYVYVF